MSEIIVIGGGAAGMMAAIVAAQEGNDVTLIEKNEKVGKKIFITGKGRCNVTNACEVEELFNNVLEHSKFLYSAIYSFDNHSVMKFFEDAGCKLKTERGLRVFPQSDHSSDVIRALENEMEKCEIKVLLNTEVKKLIIEELENNMTLDGDTIDEIDNNEKSNDDKYSKKKTKKESVKKKLKQNAVIKGVEFVERYTGKKGKMSADSVIIATGGISYVLTGSTGDGLAFAKECGHSITRLSPALVPFTVEEKWCSSLQGLSLRNVTATVNFRGKTIYSELGEMLFTHYGVSGPLMLSASSYYVHAINKLYKKHKDNINNEDLSAELFIDLKPGLTLEQLDKRVLREFDENKNKQFKNAISSLFPSKLIPIMPVLAGIDADKKVNEITKEEREQFVYLIKNLKLTLNGIRDYNEAIITSGGVSVDEVNPSTMESKIVKNLYFAGEVLDLDALTGGFNLQIAWSTGYLAGKNV